jgi:hypothetical protein
VQRLSWRWAVAGGLVVVLAALPALAGALPAGRSELSPERLRELTLGSADVGWSGYAESRGTLALPDVRELGDVAALLAGTTRTRAWWRARDDWRVDRLTLVGENDQVREGSLATTWDSADRHVAVLVGSLPARLPQPVDLLAPVLGRRLAATPDVDVAALPARRVAGVAAAGLRLTPRQRGTTTVETVDLWVDPANGLALRVEVTAQGQPAPALTSVVLDYEPAAPPPERTAFVPPPDATRTVGEAPDIAAALERFAPYVLPRELAGQARSDLAGVGTGAGVGTYGRGLSAFAVVPLPSSIGGRVSAALDDGVLDSPLLNVVVGGSGRRTYLLVGTVPVNVLKTGLASLLAVPPPRVDAPS